MTYFYLHHFYNNIVNLLLTYVPKIINLIHENYKPSIHMQIDPENHVNKLCGQGMLLEGEGKPNEATNTTEKFIAAHYVARHQQSVADKLKWDETALNLALGIEGDEVKAVYPSLYLNIAKCHEDLKNLDKALENYQLGLSFTRFLPDDGYGNMIRAGINNGIERVSIL